MFRAQAAATPMCARRGVHNTTSRTLLLVVRVCTLLRYHAQWSLMSKIPIHTCFIRRRCFFFMVTLKSRFRSSPAPPSAMTFPRSVSTPSRPRRASPLSGPVSGSLANITTFTVQRGQGECFFWTTSQFCHNPQVGVKPNYRPLKDLNQHICGRRPHHECWGPSHLHHSCAEGQAGTTRPL